MSQLQVNRINDSSGGILAPISSVMRNRIINGAMVIDQRNAGAAVTGSGEFPVDRFLVGNTTDGAFSAQQDSSAPAGFINSVKITTTTADSSLTTTQLLSFQHRIEGTNVADLGWGTANAKTVTLSFWVRSSLTGTFGGALRNSANNRSYPFTYSILAADTWEYKTVTIEGDTSGTWLTTNGKGVEVRFSLFATTGSQQTAGAWFAGNATGATGQTQLASTNGATWYITGVQLEVGTQATSFEYRQYGTELALCQRYFEKSYNTDVAPATATDTGRIDSLGSSDSGSNAIYKIIFKVTKRANPTMVGYVGGGTSGLWTYERSGASGTASVTFDVTGQASTRVVLPVGGSGFSAVYIYGQYTASAEL